MPRNFVRYFIQFSSNIFSQFQSQLLLLFKSLKLKGFPFNKNVIYKVKSRTQDKKEKKIIVSFLCGYTRLKLTRIKVIKMTRIKICSAYFDIWFKSIRKKCKNSYLKGSSNGIQFSQKCFYRVDIVLLPCTKRSDGYKMWCQL